MSEVGLDVAGLGTLLLLASLFLPWYTTPAGLGYVEGQHLLVGLFVGVGGIVVMAHAIILSEPDGSMLSLMGMLTVFLIAWKVTDPLAVQDASGTAEQTLPGLGLYAAFLGGIFLLIGGYIIKGSTGESDEEQFSPCPNCDAKLPTTAEYCSQCGVVLDELDSSHTRE